MQETARSRAENWIGLGKLTEFEYYLYLTMLFNSVLIVPWFVKKQR